MSKDTLRPLLEDGRTTNWFHVENSLIDDVAKQLRVYGLGVYVTLCRFAGNKRTCFPSQKLIGECLGISREQVRREIKKLEELGLIHVTRQKDETGQNLRNVYTIYGATTEGGGHTQPVPVPTDGATTEGGGHTQPVPVPTVCGTKKRESEEESKVVSSPSPHGSSELTTLCDPEQKEQREPQSNSKVLADRYYDLVKEKHGDECKLTSNQYRDARANFGKLLKSNPNIQPEKLDAVVEHMAESLPTFVCSPQRAIQQLASPQSMKGNNQRSRNPEEEVADWPEPVEMSFEDRRKFRIRRYARVLASGGGSGDKPWSPLEIKEMRLYNITEELLVEHILKENEEYNRHQERQPRVGTSAQGEGAVLR